jgi:hypothetical protein
VSLSDWARWLEARGVRAKVRLFQKSALLWIRVPEDRADSIRKQAKEVRPATMQVFVVGDLRWWECRWPWKKVQAER